MNRFASPSLSWVLRASLALLFASASLAASGCECDGPTRVGPCVGDDRLPGCGQECSAAAPCPSGLYCASGACTAECAPGTDFTCRAGYVCADDGRCVSASDGGERLDAPFTLPDVQFGDVEAPDNTCASVTLDATRVIPNVLLVIDRSGSMATNEFAAGETRWAALRGALLDPSSGLVPELETSVRFGVAFYSSVAGTCPDINSIPCQLRNAERIEAEYTRLTPPRGDTPTGQSINAIMAAIDTLAPERGADSPTFIVLATDGEPNTCEDGADQAGGRALSVAAVQAAHEAGIDTYVVSVGAEVATSHLQDVANAGVGGTAAPFWVATDAALLTESLRTIVRSVVSCDVHLDGEVARSQACDGTVRLGDDRLECETDWTILEDGQTIRLLGAACERLKRSGETLTASFPCEAILN